MNSESRNKIVIGVLVTVVVIVTIVLLFRMGSGNQACALQETTPAYNKSEALPKLIAKDNSSLVELFGHFESVDSSTKNVFLPLVFDKVELATNGSKSTLTLGGPCVQAVMNLEVDTTARKVNSIEISRTTVNGNVEKCTVDKLDFSSTLKQHYRCQKSHSYECKIKDNDGKEKVVASLVLDSIEFQVNGDATKTGSGTFDTPIKDCDA